MSKLNPNFSQLRKTYIFSTIEQKLKELKEKQPHMSVINLGIGDIAQPLAPAIGEAISRATLDMCQQKELKGYGPSEGYLFLRQKICDAEYATLGLSPDEIFISDGINSDIVDIQDLFSSDSRIGVPDPAYPAYLDSTVLGGRGEQIISLACLEESNFLPQPPKESLDWAYLCSPNNPTGTAFTIDQWKEWIKWAKNHQAILLIDAAYHAFIQSPNVPKSVYEIPGAKDVAIEFRSFSKQAGFTGLRCSYTVVPKAVSGTLEGKTQSLHPLWMRRQAIKFNGVAYPIQKGAEAVFSKEGKEQIQKQLQAYMQSAQILKKGLLEAGFSCFGGEDAPYIWWKIPQGLTSWEFFDQLLSRCHIISIPGVGFGKQGEGFVRLSAFTSPEIAQKTIQKIKGLNL